MECSIRQRLSLSMECLNSVWLISSKLFFFCKCMECSMAQYLQKGMELFEYFPFKELHRAFFLYWCGVLNEVNNEFLTWRALCHTFLCITMEYSMRQNLTKAMENSTLLQFKFNLNLNTTSNQSQSQLHFNLSPNSTLTSSSNPVLIQPQLNFRLNLSISSTSTITSTQYGCGIKAT